MSRILQLVSRDEPGGVRVLADSIGRGLTERGHVVETLALRGNDASIGQVVVAILRHRYDAVFGYHVAAGLVGSLLGWLVRTPLRASHLTAVPSAMRPGWRALDRVWGRLGLHTTIVANSSATAATIAAYPAAYRRRMVQIAHGVARLPVEDGAAWRARLALPAGHSLLVASGRLTAQKDHATAVRALAARPDAHLIIAGEGELRAQLDALARQLGVADRLSLPGNLDRPALAGLLAQADAYLFPSVWESFGLAGVEAAMLGVPVIAADLDVLREVLAPAAASGMARFHRPGDAAGLAAAIGTLRDVPPDLAQRQAGAAAMTARHAVAAMLDAYDVLLAAARP